MAIIWNELKLIDLDIPEYTISLCVNDDNEKEYCFVINKECVEKKVYSQSFMPPKFLKDHDLDYIVLKCSEVFGMNKDTERPELLKKITEININFNKYSKVEVQELSLPPEPFKLTSDAVALKVVSEPTLSKQLLHSYLSAYTNNPLNLAIVGPSGEGKCVKKGSLVSTRDGLMKIENIEGIRTQLLSLTSSGQTKYVENSHFWKFPETDVLNIKVICNYEITVTPEHPLLVFNKCSYEWKESKDIVVGDIIVGVHDSSFAENPYLFSEKQRDIKIQNNNFGTNGKNIPLPSLCNEKFARFLGYFHSEGNIKQNKAIGFTNTSSYLLEDYDDCIKELFGLDVKIQKRTETVHTHIIYSRKLILFLQNIGCLPKHKTYTFEIPECILMSPEKVVIEYLRAYFAGDGSVDVKRIEFASVSLEFIKQMQTLLFTKFGIISYRATRYRKTLNKAPVGRLFIRDTISLMRFINKIGFINPHQKNKANQLLKQMITLNKHKHPIPLSNIYLFPVEEISKGRAEVYDVTMPETHSFVANGLVSHNTYPALNTLKLFPKQDVMIYAGASPKSFIHDNGILVNNDFHPIEADIKELENEIEILKYKKDDDPEYIRKRKKELTNELKEIKRETKTLIDFENKILLLLDAPPKELWDNLKTLLSHDQFYLEFKFVNNDKGIKTEKVVFKGFPAFVVASARDESKWDVWEEIKTRVMVTNPDMDEAKYKKVFGFIAKAYENPWQVFEAKEEHKLEKEAKKTIKTLKQLMLNERNNMREMSNDHDESDEQLVWIPYANLISEHYKADKGARQREIKQFLQNITMSAWWNVTNRAFLVRYDEEKKYRFLIATPEDFFSAEQIFRTQGIVDFKLEFYHNIFYPCFIESEQKHQQLEDEGKIQYPFPGISVAEMKKSWKKVKGGSIITGQLLQNTYLRELDKEGFIEDLGVDNKLHKQKHWYKALVKGRTLNLDSAKKPLVSGLTVDFDVVLTNEVYINLIKPLLQNTKNVELETYQGKPISVDEILNIKNKNTTEVINTIHKNNINNNPIYNNGSLSKNLPSLTNQSSNKPLNVDTNGLYKTFSEQNPVIERQEKLIKLAKEFGDDEETLKMELMSEFNYTVDMALQDINTLRKSGVI